MNRLRLVVAAAIAGVVTLLSSGVAQAYTDCGIDLQLNDSTLVGGGNFDFKADSGAIDCAWTVTYRGEAKKGNGTSFSGSFDTPVVSKKTTSSLTADCLWDNEDVSLAPSASSSVSSAFYSTAPAKTLQAIERTCSIEATVTLLPKGGADDDSALPNTGGSNLSLLLLGGGLLLLGGGVTYMARRRHSSH